MFYLNYKHYHVFILNFSKKLDRAENRCPKDITEESEGNLTEKEQPEHSEPDSVDKAEASILELTISDLNATQIARIRPDEPKEIDETPKPQGNFRLTSLKVLKLNI